MELGNSRSSMSLGVDIWPSLKRTPSLLGLLTSKFAFALKEVLKTGPERMTYNTQLLVKFLNRTSP